MATAPFQLWIDLANVASAVRVSSTVTITTSAEHGLTSGAYVEVGNTTGAAGTSMVGVYQVTVTSGSAFTYTSAGSAGTAVVGSAFIANDLLNPPINFTAGTARQQAMVVPLDSLNLSANGDGSGSTMSFSVMQEDTPSLGPWFLKIPDNARVRLCQKDTGTAPTSADVRFLGIVASLTSQLTGSGQGTMTDVTLGDANYLLDRVGVFGKPGASRTVAGSRFTVSGTTATVAFSQVHGFVVGQPIKVGGVLLGGTADGFTGIRRVLSVAADKKSLTYAVTSGTTNTAARTTQCSFAQVGLARDRITVTGRYANLNLLDGDTITLSPPTSISGFSDSATLIRYLRGTYSGNSVIRTSANSITVVFPAPLTGSWGTFTGFGDISAVGYVSDANAGGELLVTVPGGLNEDQTVQELLSTTNAFHDEDYSLQRTFNTAGTANIIGGTAYVNQEAIQFPSTSLRSALDTIVETFGGDAKERRYYIGLDGTLNYKLVDGSAKPTYATSPLAIITSGAGDPNTTSAQATIAPYSLSVGWDHETTKNVMMTIPSTSGTPFTSVFEYDDLVDATGTAIFTTRSGPILDEVVDYPTAVKNPGAAIQRASVAYFTERHKPLLSGQFTLRGAGTQSFNQYGFSAGYAQTSGSPVLVSRWEPGQWVEVTSAELGLAGLYRVEQVEWALEPGSYVQVITVRFNRKNPSDLATLIATQTK